MDKKKAVYVPTVGEEIGNAVSHGVMSLLSLLALPFAAVWAYAHDPGGVLASVSVSVFVISIFLMFLASTLYHSMNPQSKHKEVFHILGHTDILKLHMLLLCFCMLSSQKTVNQFLNLIHCLIPHHLQEM